ncbi:MAG: transglutaminase domain-containing protein [Eubacteriales bacterium]|nr:transglutaminase domain-containing protein [Eubacteriales bacterium]
MDRLNRVLRAACLALTAAFMAGCAAFVAVRAMGFEIGWAGAYAVALAAALLVQLMHRGMAWAIAAAAAIALGLALLLGSCAGNISAMLADFRASGSLSAEQLALHAAAGRGMALIAALLLGALFAGLLRMPAGAPYALMLLLAAVICGLALNEDLSLWLAAPGLIGGVVAFGLPMERRRDGARPVLVVPALVIVLLALVLVPAGRVTWTPLESLAAQIRSIVDDYVHFTQQRLPFSINEMGYDRAGMIEDDVVAMLGGPADPVVDPVLRVETDGDILLRGTIKRSYTGYSWVDDQAKARYLYYDFTHRGVRSEVFGADIVSDSDAFVERNVSVEVLGSGTSTLFVPAHMESFSMGLTDAVYYNSTGEVFLTRDVEAGDSYSLTARVPASDAALIAAASRSWDAEDPDYAAMLEDYTALPGSIDSEVYALASSLTQNSATDAEKALAIQNYLANNYRYTLNGGYPEGNRDFVSWFLLESKEGYCSYFASAMAVMCRMSGLPARYVEGYYVAASEGGETIITGRNAHAWVEVYLKGIGWTAFDPTARAVETQRGDSDDGSQGESVNAQGASESTDGSETPYENDSITNQGGAPTPTPDVGSSFDGAPTPSPDAGDNSDGEPTPTPDPGDGQDDADNPPPENPDDGSADPPPMEPEGDGLDNAPEKDRNLTWLWILLAALVLAALIALMVLWVRRRLIATDPLRMCRATRSGAAAALILYRAMLTLLAQTGLAPMSGETPEAFAQRAVQAMPNDDYEHFVADVVRSRYSGKPLTRQTLEAGRRAYLAFLNSMRRSEKLRYTLRRVLHGIGDVEQIP